MSILERLGFRPLVRPSGAAERDTVRRIVDALDHLPEARARHLAGFAFLLTRVARADRVVSEEETRAMEQVLVRHGELPEEQAIVVAQMAKTQNLLFGGTDDFSVSKEFARTSSREQKLALIDCLFAVSAADGTIRVVEDNVIRQVADELGLEHRDFIAVRSRYRDRLAVLQTPAEPSAEPPPSG